ncbi:AAA family ATPase [Sphingopyxis sp.]|uniref:AAA family ATPase n=1 Tax=Sphingopyxis sp. TaxID=1908224 RepID=UPI001D1E09D5|nr:AAA family ATPase [Sphingopyxis sp.]MBW8296180.1 AAA family ATPase [Sphingopyxis sp.]
MAAFTLGREEPKPPANIEAEAALIGAILCENSIAAKLPPQLRAEHFFEPLHGRIFTHALNQIDRGGVASPVSLKPLFADDEAMEAVGGVGYLAQLTASSAGIIGARDFADQIIDFAARRELISWHAEQGNALRDYGRPIEDISPPETVSRSSISATPYNWREPTELPPRQWLLGRWLLRGTVACVIAPGGVGKTTFLTSAALSLVTGRQLLGKPVWGGQKRVWIWNLEDDGDELARAIQAAAKHHGIAPADLTGLYVDSGLEGRTLCTATIRDGQFHLFEPVFRQLARELKRREIDALFLDPFVSSHEVDENDNARVDRIAKAWARVARDANCSIVLVHHASKNGSSEVTAQSSRGASALVNAARSALVVNRMDETEAQRLGIMADDRRRYIRVQDDKANRAPAEAADWFRLVSVDLENGEPGDSVGVVEPWSLPDPFDDVSVDDLRNVQERLAGGEWRENHQASEWVGNLVAEVLEVDISASPGKAKVRAIVDQWIRSGALRIEERRDSKRKPRKYVVVGEHTPHCSTVNK